MDEQPEPQNETPRRSFFRFPGAIVLTQLFRWLMLGLLVAFACALIAFVLPRLQPPVTPTAPVTAEVTTMPPSSPFVTESRTPDSPLTVHPTQTPTPPQPEIYFVEFQACSGKSDALLETLQARVGDTIAVVGETSGATAQPEQTLLAVSGRCAENGDLTLDVTFHGVDNLPELSQINSLTVTLAANDDLADRPVRLLLALADYGQGDFARAVPRLERLVEEANSPDEQHRLALLLAAAEMLSGTDSQNYEEAIAVYDQIIDSESEVEDRVLAAAYNNRGFARLNLLVRYLQQGQPYDELLSGAESDWLEAAELAGALDGYEDEHARALVNLGTLYASFESVDDALETADGLCTDARNIARDGSIKALAYVCQTIVTFSEVSRLPCDEYPEIQPVYDDLDAAEAQSEFVPSVHLWRAIWLGNCGVQSLAGYRAAYSQFRNLVDARHAELAVEAWLVNLFIDLSLLSNSEAS